MPVDFNLADRARRTLLAFGFRPDFPAGAAHEVRAAERVTAPAALDLTHLLWSSIDNEESRDLDQLEYAEPCANGSIRILLAIADVASHVRRDSAIDQRARHNTVSLYTAGETFHLLPHELSTGQTSLLQGETRLALVVDMLVEDDGEIHDPKVRHARVRNQARLTYEGVGAWLESSKRLIALEETPGLKEQLKLQALAAQRLTALRRRMGALTFCSSEARPVIREGRCVSLELLARNRARDLIESLMIAANVATANVLKSRGFPIIERSVQAPKRWDRICQIAASHGAKLPETPSPKPLADWLAERRLNDPDGFPDLSFMIRKLLGPGEYRVEPPDQQLSGHFGLALDDYSHSTAPNRRYADLVIQRLLFASIRGEPVPYPDAGLREIAQRCTEMEDAARKAERFMRKVAAADLIQSRLGQTFPAVVTGASYKGTYVRLSAPPVEGRVVRGEHELDVGDRIQVRLIAADPERAFIDFERV